MVGLPVARRQATPTASRRRRLPAASLAALAALVALGGCGGSEEPSPSGGPTATTAAPASSAGGPTASGPTAGEPAALGDGRHPVYLKTVDPDRRMITFDLIQFFTGEAATKAAAADNKESPPPNDYYIRNVNPRLRTMPVAADAPITVNVLAAQSTGSSTKDVPVTMAKLASYFPNSGRHRSGSPWRRAR